MFRGKKSLNFGNGNSNGSSNHGLIDMFSKTTRHLVQKVRNKSSSSSSTSSNPTSNEIHATNNFSSDQTDDSDHNHYTNGINESFNSTQKLNLYCHKYSADDIHYLNIQTKGN